MQFPFQFAGPEDIDGLVGFFCEDIQNLTKQQLTAYPGGWPNHLPMAILDAVFSIRAQYTTKHGKGLAPRLAKFKEMYPLAAQELHEFLKLTENQISDILGYGVTAGNPKSRAALEVASNLANLEIYRVYGAQDFDPSNRAHRHAYLDVRGLGKATFRYLSMLLGHGDVKPDVWIIRAVQRVADTHDIDVVVTEALAHKVVTYAHEITGLGETVTHLDHAIWLNERENHPVAVQAT
ncbi:hypothetical protein [Glutamicibacter arilaitensis]|uniref:hypothetical protein n=1 Tax=Glutamicibacter arilaitensis TaxID=256701 RepID=UPI003F957840